MGTLNPRSYWKFHEDFWIDLRMSLSQNKIHRIRVELSEDAQGKYVSDRHPFDYWIEGLPIIYPPLFHAPMVPQVWFVFDEPSVSWYITIKGPYFYNVIFNIHLYSPDQFPVLVVLMNTDIFSPSLQKVHPIRLNGGFLEGKVIVSCFCVRC